MNESTTATRFGSNSARIILQQELISPTGRYVDVSDLLETDFGRGTIAIIYEALSRKKISPNKLLIAVLSNTNGRYYGQVLGMALRMGANPNLYVDVNGSQYFMFMYAIQNMKNPVYLRDYYLIMLASGMNLNSPIVRGNVPSINVNGRVLSSKTSIAQYITLYHPQGLGSLNGLDPVTSSRIGILAGKKSMMVKGSYTINDVVGNHLPPDFIPRPDQMKAWVNMTLYASIAYMNYPTFSDTLKRMPTIPYPTANDIILNMYRIQLENRFLINIYQQMLNDLNSRGYKLDVWQRRMLMRVSEQSTPACSSIAQQFPVDFSMLTSRMGESELRTMNNICDYANESSPIDAKCEDGEGIPYSSNGRRYCFKPSQFPELLRTGVNPNDGSQLRPSFLNRIRNYYGSTMPSSDSSVGEFIYNTGVTLEDKTPAQLETIVREVFDTGNLRELQPEHARVTAAWIGNWAKNNDPRRYNLYLEKLGARSTSTPLGSVEKAPVVQTNQIRRVNKPAVRNDGIPQIRGRVDYPTPDDY
jgi:hypothetical protein